MRSIRHRLSVAVGAVAVFVLVGGALGLFLSLRHALQKTFDESLATKADALVTASEIEDGNFEIDLDVQAFAGFGSNTPGDYYEILTPEGRTLQRSPSLGTADLPEITAEPGDREGFADLALPEGIEGRAFWTTFTPADDNENRFTDLKIVVASDLTSLNRTLGIVATVMAGFVTSGVIVTLVLLRLVVSATLRPLDRLGGEVENIGAHRLTERVRDDGLPRELRSIATKINELLERLEATFARERRFTSHAAHELRTPLAELKSMIELGAAWPDELTADHVCEMRNVVRELEGLLEKLTVLSRAEAGEGATREPIDLKGNIQDALESRQETISRRGLKIDLEAEEGRFSSDPLLWRAILNNLLDNAIDYAPAGTTVDIFASPALLRIRNEAPDLTEEDLERMFERFWRKPNGLSKGKHSGLGLSIVKSSVEFLGGNCRAERRNGRLEFRIEWES